MLANIPDPPSQLFVLGDSFAELLQRPLVAIVGSRKVSAYGKAVTAKLASELAAEGVVIVSGLAIGVDGVAHQAALDTGGLTLAVMPCSLDRIYPTSHYHLAQRMLQQGGALLSEYPEGSDTYPSNFIGRNRLVSGISSAVLITEASEKSGALHTARFALEQGKDVLAVPGNITSPTSSGTNNLLKTGAALVTSSKDILHILGIKPASRKAPKGDTPNEQVILDLIYSGMSDGGELLATSKLGASLFGQAITMLEITGKVRALGANQWSLS